MRNSTTLGLMALLLIGVLMMVACQPTSYAPTIQPTLSPHPEPVEAFVMPTTQSEEALTEYMEAAARYGAQQTATAMAVQQQQREMAIAGATATAQWSQLEYNQAVARATATAQWEQQQTAARATATTAWQATADAMAWQGTQTALRVEEMDAAARATAQIMAQERQNSVLPLTLTPAMAAMQNQMTVNTLKLYGGIAGIVVACLLFIIGLLAFVTVQSTRRMPDGTLVVPAFLAWIAGVAAIDPLRATGPIVKTWMGRNEVPLVGDPEQQEQENRRAGFIRLTAAAAGGNSNRSKNSELPKNTGFAPPTFILVAEDQAPKVLDGEVMTAIDQDWEKRKPGTGLARRT